MMTAATGMEAQQLYMDIISNNLSNVNTVGFKRSKVEFQDLMYQTIREPGVRNFEGAMAPAGIETGLGVRPAATQRIFEQGAPNRTENELDWLFRARVSSDNLARWGYCIYPGWLFQIIQ
jgi:flagellar basal-body rod protein FlgG